MRKETQTQGDACPAEVTFCGCGRGALPLGDPPRREGLPSYSHWREAGLVLEDSNRAWRKAKGKRVMQLPQPPYLRTVPEPFLRFQVF
jgi:hypothetical protein